jgi:MFS transporter, CP family, cyanate transporter
MHVSARAWLLVSALALTGLSMRTAVTSVGAVLDDIEAGLHTSSSISGVLTTLPVICFAGLGAATPRLAGRFGAHRMVVAGLVAATIGTLLRAAVSAPWLFLVLSLLALSGGAIANVLLPSLVKEHFPDRIGQMTAVYTTALAVGTTAGAGLTVPIGDLGNGWRFGIGSWAVFDLLAVLPWLVTLRGERPHGEGVARLRPRALARSRTAWYLTAFFGMQSMQAYITFGWFERFLHEHGIAASTAGWMVALLSALGIPASIVAPNVPIRYHRLLMHVLSLCFVIAYIGLGVAPVGGAWVWMILSGIGNGMFPLALTLIGLRSRTPHTTRALSAFVQAIGYVVAGVGPLLFGVLYGATGSWVLPLALLWIALALAWLFGWLACAPRYVDDELPQEVAAPASV